MMQEQAQMTYEECLRSTFLDYQSWTFFLIGLGIAIGFGKFGRRRLGAATAIVGAVIGIVVAYTYYEMNCVELYLG